MILRNSYQYTFGIHDRSCVGGRIESVSPVAEVWGSDVGVHCVDEQTEGTANKTARGARREEQPVLSADLNSSPSRCRGERIVAVHGVFESGFWSRHCKRGQPIQGNLRKVDGFGGNEPDCSQFCVREFASDGKR